MSKAFFQQRVEGLVLHCQRHLLGRELLLQFAQLFLEYELSHVAVHIVEDHRAAQSVDELRLKRLLHLFQHRLAPAHVALETNRCLSRILCAGIRCHNQDHVAEVSLASFVICQSGVVHHLQQNVIDILMRLLDLVEQQHAVRCLADGVRQQSTVLIAHITRRRADEFGHRVLLRIFTHVEAQQLDAQFLGQHACHLCLTHARGTNEEQRCRRFVVVQQSRFRHLHRLDHLSDGLVLSVDLRGECRV